MPHPEHTTDQLMLDMLVLEKFVYIMLHVVQGLGQGSQDFDVKLVKYKGEEHIIRHEVPSRKYPSIQDIH